MISFDRLAIPHPLHASSHPSLGDDSRIDVTALREVDYWTEALGVSEAELRIAVAAVGVSTQDVRDHLGR